MENSSFSDLEIAMEELLVYGFFGFCGLAIVVICTRYLFGGRDDAEIRPIWYVIGIILAPLTVVLALLKWLFFGRA